MHGKIFVELKKFVESQSGPDAWSQLLSDAGLGSKMYMPVTEYPDQEIVAIVSAASRATGKSIPELLEAFGEFIVPALLGMYYSLINPEWKTLDVIEHTEDSIHKVVRIKNPGALPPQLKTTRISANEVKLLYSSPRKMCSIARGIARGLARRYDEQLTITETQCMNNGSSRCELTFRVTG